jgi:hypothetical protein
MVRSGAAGGRSRVKARERDARDDAIARRKAN